MRAARATRANSRRGPRPAAIAARVLLLAGCLLAIGCRRDNAAIPAGGVVRARGELEATPRPAPRPTRPGAQAVPLPLVDRLDAVAGRTMLIPLDAPREPAPPASLPLRLDDGRLVPAPVVWVGVDPAARPAWSWLPNPGRWLSLHAPQPPPPDTPGQWFALVDLPTGNVGTGLWFGGTRAMLNPLPDPLTIGPSPGALPWPAAAEPHATNITLNLLAEPERLDPTRRWRHRLRVDGLAPELPQRRDVDPADAAAVLDAMATDLEARWQVALAWLHVASPDTSRRLRQALAGAIDFGPEPGQPRAQHSGLAQAHAAPVRLASELETQQLLAALLEPGIAPRQRVAIAAAFLDGQPRSLVWVIDDAGLADSLSSRPLATIGLANLRATPALGVVVADGRDTPQMIPLPPHAARPIVPSYTSAAGDAARPTLRIGTRGDWATHEPAAQPRPAPLAPPGAPIAGLLADWTMPGFMSGTPDVGMLVPDAWATAALLYRDDLHRTDAGFPAPRWVVLVECRAGPDSKPGEPDALELWLGPWNAPAGAWRIEPDRPPTRLAGDADIEIITGASTPASAAPVDQAPTADERTWTVALALPTSAIDASGVLRLGLVRRDARGVRSAWPRPMLPWQSEPGRAAFDTTSWRTVPIPPTGRPR